MTGRHPRLRFAPSRFVLFAVLASASAPALVRAATLDDLVRAYPGFLAGHDGTTLSWKDGTRMPVSDGRDNKGFEETLRHPSIRDQLALPYVAGPLPGPPAAQHDPGRFRVSAFFDKMYGDCTKGEVQRHLISIPWLPGSGGGTVRITGVNGVAGHLRAVSEELDRLPPALRAYAMPGAGTFHCRPVADTGNRSMHAWGAAIDLNTKYADYWLWNPGGPWRNRIPLEIVTIFERHGFIWGGKWAHFDTMHFEYRPELLGPGRQGDSP